MSTNTQVDRRPKTTFVYEAAPGRHLAEFSMSIPNVPGMLATASGILAKHHVNVLSGYHDKARWSFFVDLTESDASVEEVQRELASIPGVAEVVKSDSPTGIAVDSLHFPLMLADKRAVILRAETLSSILERVGKVFGEDGSITKVLLARMGEAAGQAMYKATAAQIGDKIREELTSVMDLYSATGLGVFRISDVDFDRGTATVVAFDNFECAFHPYARSKPFSQFVRGHLAGLFSEIFGQRVVAEEIACLARGDAYCEFKVEPRNRGRS